MEENGIGRPSTYAPTVSTILDREYVIKEGKYLRLTPLGGVVNDLMCQRFPDIVDVKFTARMEQKLDDVESGQVKWKDLIRQFYVPFHENLEKVEKDMEGVYLKVPDEVTEEKCDLCGRNMVIKSGRFGRFLACPGYPECKFTKPLVVEMPGRCPKCGGRILKKTSRNGYTYYGCDKFPRLRLHDLGRAREGRLPCLRPHHVQKRRARASTSPSAPIRVPQLPAGGQARLPPPQDRGRGGSACGGRIRSRSGGRRQRRKSPPPGSLRRKKTAAARKTTTKKATAAKTTAKKTTTKKDHEEGGGINGTCNCDRRGSGGSGVRLAAGAAGAFRHPCGR